MGHVAVTSLATQPSMHATHCSQFMRASEHCALRGANAPARPAARRGPRALLPLLLRVNRWLVPEPWDGQGRLRVAVVQSVSRGWQPPVSGRAAYEHVRAPRPRAHLAAHQAPPSRHVAHGERLRAAVQLVLAAHGVDHGAAAPHNTPIPSHLRARPCSARLGGPQGSTCAREGPHAARAFCGCTGPRATHLIQAAASGLWRAGVHVIALLAARRRWRRCGRLGLGAGRAGRAGRRVGARLHGVAGGFRDAAQAFHLRGGVPARTCVHAGVVLRLMQPSTCRQLRTLMCHTQRIRLAVLGTPSHRAHSRVTHLDLDVALVAPLGAPAVLDQPVGGLICASRHSRQAAAEAGTTSCEHRAVHRRPWGTHLIPQQQWSHATGLTAPGLLLPCLPRPP